ncbi:VWD domain-containing protein, partial [Salmonella sp. s54412]|uniref:VWD domain-containing protein n=1 Tax=Salmonella sp. s54412 TaxID=3160128 RepID=UPI003754111C
TLSIAVAIEKYYVEIVRGGEVTASGVKVDFKDQSEVNVLGFNIIREENNKVKIQTNLGYIVEFGGSNNVQITVDFAINDRTMTGLCGNHNGNPDDDALSFLKTMTVC